MILLISCSFTTLFDDDDVVVIQNVGLEHSSKGFGKKRCLSVAKPHVNILDGIEILFIQKKYPCLIFA
jgi:hypothetical protein